MSRRLLKSVARVGSLTFVSRVLGFIRDMVIARVFGASVGADAFFVAFRIPNFLRRLFAEGAFSQSFVPVLSEYRETRDHDEVRDLVSHVAGVLGGALALVTVAGVLAAPVLVAVFAPGFVDDADKYRLTVSMVRITFPYIAFISLAAFAGAVLNTYGNFGAPAFTPVFLNLSLIAAAVLLAPHLERPVTALAIGVLIAGIVQLGFLLPFVARLRLLVRPRWGWRHSGVRRVLRLMAPAAFGASVVQINLLIDTLIASFLVTGSITWLYYSDRMVEFPLGVFGIALATVILPGLSGDHASGSPRAFSRKLDWALRLALVIALPSAVGLAVLAGPILTTLFRYGAFGASDVEMATSSLIAYSAGLVAFVAIKILAPGYFARQDTRTPVRIGLVAMVANLVFNLSLVWPLAHAGLALATSLSAFVNAGLLLRGLLSDGAYAPESGWPALIARVAIANVAMAAGLLLVVGEPGTWLAAGAGERAGRLAVLVAGGAAVYALALLALGLRPRHLLEARER